MSQAGRASAASAPDAAGPTRKSREILSREARERARERGKHRGKKVVVFEDRRLLVCEQIDFVQHTKVPWERSHETPIDAATRLAREAGRRRSQMLEHVYVVLVKLKRSVRERDFVEPVERIDAERQQREDTPAIEERRLEETRPLPPVGEPVAMRFIQVWQSIEISERRKRGSL